MIAPAMAVATASSIELHEGLDEHLVREQPGDVVEGEGCPSAVVNAPMATTSVGRIRNSPT